MVECKLNHTTKQTLQVYVRTPVCCWSALSSRLVPLASAAARCASPHAMSCLVGPGRARARNRTHRCTWRAPHANACPSRMSIGTRRLPRTPHALPTRQRSSLSSCVSLNTPEPNPAVSLSPIVTHALLPRPSLHPTAPPMLLRRVALRAPRPATDTSTEAREHTRKASHSNPVES